MGDEKVISAVNERSDQARNRAKLEARISEAQAMEAEEKARAAAAKKAMRLRKKANRQIILRAVAALVVCTLFWLAGFFGLMDGRLTVPVMGTVCSWFGFWFGAWVQFMWADGGLLNVNAE